MPREQETHAEIRKQLRNGFPICEHFSGGQDRIDRAWRQQGMMPHCEQHVSALSAEAQLLLQPYHLRVAIAIKVVFKAVSIIVEHKEPIALCNARYIGKARLMDG